jgi:hypothetical protein
MVTYPDSSTDCNLVRDYLACCCYELEIQFHYFANLDPRLFCFIKNLQWFLPTGNTPVYTIQVGVWGGGHQNILFRLGFIELQNIWSTALHVWSLNWRSKIWVHVEEVVISAWVQWRDSNWKRNKKIRRLFTFELAMTCDCAISTVKLISYHLSRSQ